MIFAFAATVALLVWMGFFMMGSLPLMILKHDTPMDARFVRGLFNLYYWAVIVTATAGGSAIWPIRNIPRGTGARSGRDGEGPRDAVADGDGARGVGGRARAAEGGERVVGAPRPVEAAEEAVGEQGVHLVVGGIEAARSPALGARRDHGVVAAGNVTVKHGGLLQKGGGTKPCHCSERPARAQYVV